jgi:hypothetical protein
MECVPADSTAVVKVAFPALSVPVPSAVPASSNFTIPVGVPDEAVTLAVKVTL